MRMRNLFVSAALLALAASGAAAIAGGLNGPGPIQTSSLNPGGNFATIVTAPASIKLTGNGVLFRVIPISVGSSSGTLTLADIAAPAYSATVTYSVGQAVIYSGTVYFCTAVSTGNLPTNASFFGTTIPSGINYVSIPFGSMTAGVALAAMEMPLKNGLTVVTVPSAGSPSYVVTYN